MSVPKSEPLPHKISTLLYAFNHHGETLLLHRLQEPNLGLWSPCGGKLHTHLGESPHACARREALEELDLHLESTQLHLTGIVSEHGYAGHAHWLMFLFEILTPIPKTPPPIREGSFNFFSRTALDSLPIPQTDRDQLWPLFWRHRRGFFAAHCHCHPDGTHSWTLEESRPAPPADLTANL